MLIRNWKMTGRQKPASSIQLTFIPDHYKSAVSGLFTGVVLAGLFNPWDRALYLSVKDHRPFLSVSNFTNPYHGFTQAIVQRTLSGGLYFTLQNVIEGQVDKVAGGWDPSSRQLLVGLSAGVTNGLLLNQLAAVKYHAWGKDNSTFLSAAKHIVKHGGFPMLFKGSVCTAMRDGLFGITYEISRLWIRNCMYRNGQKMKKREQEQQQQQQEEEEGGADEPDSGIIIDVPSKYYYFLANVFAAVLATAVSAPLNFARTMKFAAPPSRRPPSVWSALVRLAENTRRQPSLGQKLSYAQQRLRVGWGTTRVGVGMATGQALFEYVHNKL